MSQSPISIQHSCRVPIPVEKCFATFLKLNPKDFLHHDKLIARLKKIEMVKGDAFDEEGAVQDLTFADGAVIRETLVALVDNQQIVYEGRGFSQPMVNWVDFVRASFEFEPKEGGTQFTWRYNFFLKPSFLTPLKKPLFQAVVVNFIWQRMMTHTLANLVKVLTLRARG